MNNRKKWEKLILFAIVITIVLAIVVIALIILNWDKIKPQEIKTGITLNPSRITESIIQGTTKKVEMAAKVTGVEPEENGETRQFKWVSDNEKVAVIEGSGDKATVTLKAEGNAILTVTYGELTTSCIVVVTELKQAIKLSETNITESIIKGETKTLDLTATLENVTAKDAQTQITWTSDNENVAVVEGQGDKATVTLKAAGDAVVTATYGELTATCTVHVVELVPTITLKTTSISQTIIKGQTQTVTLEATTENITEELTWTSSNTKVASVAGNGNTATVTLKAKGTTTITVTDGNVKATCKVTVNEKTLEQGKATILLNPESIEKKIITGETATETIKAELYNASGTKVTGTVTWTSSNTNVATVSNGKVTIKGAGTATITAKWSGVTAKCIVKVETLSTKITLSPTSVTLNTGNEQRLIETVTNKPANATVTWKSSNESVATVTNGVVTAKGAGTATITAAVTGTNASATCKVTVSTKITLNSTNIVLDTGKTQQLTATTNLQGATVAWTSSNNNVATVSTNGLVTAKGAGTANITATVNGVSATCKVTVPTTITLNTTSVSLTKGATRTLTATTNLQGATVAWTSSNDNVATVSNGVVTAKGAGTANITATVNGASATCKVTVTEPTPTTISLNRTSASLNKGGTVTITATTSPSNATVAWSSSNTSVATVSNGVVTAVAKGTATITATISGTTVKATCVVTVTEPTSTTITLYPTSVTLQKDRTYTLTATTTPTNATVTWSSSNSSVATVSNGVVTAVGKGTATITATISGTTVKATCAVTVLDSKIILDPTSVTLNKGETKTIKATLQDMSGTVSWTSSNSSVASVSSGVVTAVGKGTATITATCAGKTATCTVTVTEPTTTTITLNPTNMQLVAGGTPASGKITATTTPTNATVIWKSANESVATVDSNGNVTAKAGGFTIITATVSGTTVKATCTVQVGVAAPTITLNPTSVTLNKGETRTITATTNQANATVRWSSNNTSVATVDSNGKVTAVGAGTATITATVNGVSATCNVTVKETKVFLSPTAINSMKFGATATITATTYNPTNATVEWSSSNTSVATVSNGVVTAVGAGTATITATANGVSATCSVTVNEPTIRLSAATAIITIGATETLTATTYNTTNTTVTWSSSNSSVATVDSNGKVTAKSVGTATITAKITGTMVKATCTIKVEELSTKITLSSASATLNMGKTQQLTATTNPTNATVTWSSSNSSVASVDSNGKVTAKAAGTATITAKITANGVTVSDTCTVKVNSAKKIVLSPTSLHFNYTNQTSTITATLYDDYGEKTTGTVAWSSSNKLVANVGTNGLVLSTGNGSATITASWDGVSATCDVSVGLLASNDSPNIFQRIIQNMMKALSVTTMTNYRASMGR